METIDVSHDSVVAMARAAREAGVEMIVLDDGWFGERHDATSSLGDWAPNAAKFPFGIRGLVHEVNSEGLQFGIWIEPEMISTNSELYAAHPDWCLQVPGRKRHEGRNQLVLDLTREEVREHIFESIAVTLRGANIRYVKWDMNRHLTEAFSVTQLITLQGPDKRVLQCVETPLGTLRLGARASVSAEAPARISFAFDEGYFETEWGRLPYPVPFKFLPAGEAAAWIDTAYLSPRLRVSDGNKGTRFVLKRVGS